MELQMFNVVVRLSETEFHKFPEYYGVSSVREKLAESFESHRSSAYRVHMGEIAPEELNRNGYRSIVIRSNPSNDIFANAGIPVVPMSCSDDHICTIMQHELFKLIKSTSYPELSDEYANNIALKVMNISVSLRCNFCFVSPGFIILFKIYDTQSTFFFCNTIFEGEERFMKLFPTKEQCDFLCYGQCVSGIASPTEFEASCGELLYPFINVYNHMDTSLYQLRIAGHISKLDTFSLRNVNHVEYIRHISYNLISRGRLRHASKHGALHDAQPPVNQKLLFERIYSSVTFRFMRPVNLKPLKMDALENFVDYYNSFNAFYHPFMCTDNYLVLMSCSFTDYTNSSGSPLCLATYAEVSRSFRCCKVYACLYSMLLNKHEIRPMLARGMSSNGVIEFSYYSYTPFQALRDIMLEKVVNAASDIQSLIDSFRAMPNKQKVSMLRNYNIKVSRGLFYDCEAYGIALSDLLLIFDGLLSRLTPKITGIKAYEVDAEVSSLFPNVLSYRRQCYAARGVIKTDDVTAVHVNVATAEVILPCGLVTTLASPILHQHGCVRDIYEFNTKVLVSFGSIGEVMQLSFYDDQRIIERFKNDTTLYRCSVCEKEYLDLLGKITCQYGHLDDLSYNL